MQNAVPVIKCYGLDYYKILLSVYCSDLSKLNIDNLSKPEIQKCHAVINCYGLDLVKLSIADGVNPK